MSAPVEIKSDVQPVSVGASEHLVRPSRRLARWSFALGISALLAFPIAAVVPRVIAGFSEIGAILVTIISSGALLVGGSLAIFLGHRARGRAKRAPDQYGGANFALGGLVGGYVVSGLFVLGLGVGLLPGCRWARSTTGGARFANKLE